MGENRGQEMLKMQRIFSETCMHSRVVLCTIIWSNSPERRKDPSTYSSISSKNQPPYERRLCKMPVFHKFTILRPAKMKT